MAIIWIPGRRIEKLPKIIQPVAILSRNISDILRKKERIRETESEVDVRRKLSLGVEYVCESDVTGDIAEFGTMSGKTAIIMAKALSRFDRFKNGPKKLCLFDSFKGLPQAESIIDKDSPHMKSGTWGIGVCLGISKEALKRACRRFFPENKIIIYDGWFKDTLSQIPKGAKFAMLHIDCDMYKSTIEVLDYLFQNRHIAEGAVIFFDDYNCNRASPNFGERKAWAEVVNKFSVVFTDSGEYSWSGRKFIIHHYHNTE